MAPSTQELEPPTIPGRFTLRIVAAASRLPKCSLHLSLPVQAVRVNSGSGATRVPTLKFLQDVDMEHSLERRSEK